MNGMVLSWNVDLYFYFPISTYPSLNRARDERDYVFCLSLQFRCHVIIAEVLILCDSFIEKVRQLIILYLRTAEFAIPRFRTNKYGKHSLTYLGPKLWNKLPSEIRTLPSLFSFKNCIRKLDLGVMIDDDNCSNCILCNS